MQIRRGISIQSVKARLADVLWELISQAREELFLFTDVNGSWWTLAFYDKDRFPGGPVIRAINQLPGEGKEGKRRGRDVVSHPLSATTEINHSRTAWSAAMHQQAPRKRTPDRSHAGGKAFSSPIIAERHGNQWSILLSNCKQALLLTFNTTKGDRVVFCLRFRLLHALAWISHGQVWQIDLRAHLPYDSALGG